MQKVLKSILLLFMVIVPVLFYSCGASSTVRYDRGEEKNEKGKTGKENEMKTYKEDFDISKFRTKIDIKEKPAGEENTSELNPWYEYKDSDTSSASSKSITGTTNGFRVQVLSTDKLEEADSLKSELILKLNQKNVYVIFDPPFYKVEVGDFVNMADAKNLNFKLTQLGYTDSRVIASTVNIFE